MKRSVQAYGIKVPINICIKYIFDVKREKLKTLVVRIMRFILYRKYSKTF
jgi:hypothetical protein